MAISLGWLSSRVPSPRVAFYAQHQAAALANGVGFVGETYVGYQHESVGRQRGEEGIDPYQRLPYAQGLAHLLQHFAPRALESGCPLGLAFLGIVRAYIFAGKGGADGLNGVAKRANLPDALGP